MSFRLVLTVQYGGAGMKSYSDTSPSQWLNYGAKIKVSRLEAFRFATSIPSRFEFCPAEPTKPQLHKMANKQDDTVAGTLI